MERTIRIDIEHTNCSAEFYINGIPLRKYENNEQPFSSIPAGYYLIDGINEVEVVVNPGLIPSRAREGKNEVLTHGAVASIRLVSYPLGVYPKDPGGKIIGEAVYTGSTDHKDIFPKTISSKIELGKQYGRWAWQDADNISLDDVTRKLLVSEIKQIYDAWAIGNGVEMLKKAKPRWDDASRVLPRTNRAERERRYLEDLKEGREPTKHEWIMEPFDPSTFDLRVVAGGKMVQAIDKNYKPIVRTKPIPSMDGFVVDYPMFLSRIKGEWYIVR